MNNFEKVLACLVYHIHKDTAYFVDARDVMDCEFSTVEIEQDLENNGYRVRLKCDHHNPFSYHPWADSVDNHIERTIDFRNAAEVEMEWPYHPAVNDAVFHDSEIKRVLAVDMDGAAYVKKTRYSAIQKADGAKFVGRYVRRWFRWKLVLNTESKGKQ